MRSSIALSYLQVLTNTANNLFNLIPVRFTINNHVTVNPHHTKYMIFWILFLNFSMLNTTAEFIYYARGNLSRKTLLIALYQSFFLIAKPTGLLMCAMYHTRAKDIKNLLQFFIRYPRGIVKCPSTKRENEQNCLFISFLLIIPTSFAILFVPTVPMIALIIPCIHYNHAFSFVFGEHCQISWWFRLVISMDQFFFFLPISMEAAHASAIGLVALNELQRNLKNLR